jgi:hypothetical protein
MAVSWLFGSPRSEVPLRTEVMDGPSVTEELESEYNVDYKEFPGCVTMLKDPRFNTIKQWYKDLHDKA